MIDSLLSKGPVVDVFDLVVEISTFRDIGSLFRTVAGSYPCIMTVVSV